MTVSSIYKSLKKFNESKMVLLTFNESAAILIVTNDSNATVDSRQ